MAQMIDLKEIERKAFVSYHKDGLLDLFLGFMMLVSILSSTLDQIGFSDSVRIAIYAPLMIILGPLMYVFGKKYITTPRLGYVKFGPNRRSARKKVLVISIAVVLLTLVIWTVLSGEKINQMSKVVGPFGMSAIIVLIIMGFFSFAAFITDYNRMYLSGAIVALIEPLHIFIEKYTNIKFVGIIAYGISGVILIIMGTKVLRDFMKKYPLPKQGEAEYIQE